MAAVALHTGVAQPRGASWSAVAASRPGQSKNPRLGEKSRLLDPIGASSSEATSRPERHGSVSASVRIRTMCVHRRTLRSQLVFQALDIRCFFFWHAGCTVGWIQPGGHPMANRHRASDVSSRGWRRPFRRPPRNTARWWSAAPKEAPHPHSVLRYRSEMLSEDAECCTTI